ncbi:MAG: hypothetical protein M1140_10460, partial [Chloroflexi bacterium]|nr:hypothetical protein [Chloroflexota bacterium]
LVAKPPADLYGLVTFRGASASNVSVMLRLYDGLANSTVATTTTDANGWYHFLDRPALTAGQEYWIRYNNDENSVDRLSVWFTGIITTYASGERHQFATFDIADVVLNSPASRAVVAPPTVFTWTPRAASPAESYAMWIFDPTGVFTRSYTSGLLGYAGTTSISTIPAGMSLLTLYGWFVELHAADGGYGEPY